MENERGDLVAVDHGNPSILCWEDGAVRDRLDVDSDTTDLIGC